VRQGATPTSDPLSGFLNLSAVSKQATGPQPCFVPQPFLGCLPSELSPRRERTPLSELLLPCSYPHPCRGAPREIFHSPFRRRPRSHAVAWFPGSLWTPFPQTRRLAFRLPWISRGEATPFRMLHLLRSLVPPANPFALARVAPDQRPMLSWSSAPLESSPPAPRVLKPALISRPEHASSPEGSSARHGGPRDPPAGWTPNTEMPGVLRWFLTPFEVKPRHLSVAPLLPRP
jgi:hypothetical protein